jgi:long-chain acyl-CoA synthetase
VFFAVPRVWEKFHAGVSAKLADATGAKAKTGAWAQKVGQPKVTDLRSIAGKAPIRACWRSSIAWPIAWCSTRSSRRSASTRCQAAVSGAAPIDKEILEFFAGFDLSILEVYGQSEGTGPSTFNRPGRRSSAA